MTLDRDRLARIILAGINDIREWSLGDAEKARTKGYPREFAAGPVDDFGTIFVDLALEASTGELICHEVNGPNAIGSDALTGNSDTRAENEARQAVRRARELGDLAADGTFTRKVVAVQAHQHWPQFRTGGEFYPRCARFADHLERLLDGPQVECLAGCEDFTDAPVTVVMGDVPTMAGQMRFDSATRRFYFRDRPVIFIGNPNVLSDMIRLGTLDRSVRDTGNPGLRVVHAWRFAGLTHDKARQQELFEDTGVRPLRHFSANSVPETLEKAKAMLADGPVVIKPSNTSGGVGVTVLTQGMAEGEIAARIDALLEACRRKYGDGGEAMAMPIRGFEFVQSTGYPMSDGGGHIWDLRFGVEFEPGKAFVYPVTLRLAPKPFDPATFQDDRDQWISNVTGRVETFLKSGMDDDVLAAVGMTEELMERAMLASATWTCKAWDAMARDGGRTGSVFEDSRDTAEKPFYQGEKFAD
jgi:hypothetical protein